jgi:diguanylate cyclase (GGDEF)-like protein
MKKISNRFLSQDQISLGALALLVFLLALGGVKVSQAIGKNLLIRDGLDMTNAWADGLLKNSNEIPAIVGGAEPTAPTLEFLRHASKLGDVYRYRIRNKAGELVFDSDHLDGPLSSPTVRHGPQVDVPATASIHLMESDSRQSSENPIHYAVSHVPIRQNDAIVGSFEIYLDESDDYALYEGSLHLNEFIIGIAVLLAGGLPSVMVHRKMLAYRKSQKEIIFLAEHDSLTGVANRHRLEEAMKGMLAWNRRNDLYIAVLLIDLDRFKEINDNLGHGVGDQVLKALAGRLNSAVRLEDMVGRLGGDEFVILQAGMSQPEGAEFLTHRLIGILREPYDIDGLKVTCNASIGIAIAPGDAQQFDALFSCADAALYKAKTEGRNSACFYEAGMDASLRERQRLERELRRALDLKAFQLAYQPLVTLHDGNLIGFEALLRWPEGWDPQPPAAFIPVAESYGLIVPLGSWALETACATAAAWTKPLKIAVNLSPVQFSQGDIVADVIAALKSSGLDPARLELEVTESLWLQDTDGVHSKLMQLRAIGVSISLDDFGTGYSSLAYLWKFPFDAVKIDRSFVMCMEEDPKAAAIVNTIVVLGRGLALTVTAEGVETDAQAKFLTSIGCEQAQGYLFGRPLSLSAANQLANAPDPQSAVNTLEPLKR